MSKDKYSSLRIQAQEPEGNRNFLFLEDENKENDKENAEEHPRKRFLTEEKSISSLLQKAEDIKLYDNVI